MSDYQKLFAGLGGHKYVNSYRISTFRQRNFCATEIVHVYKENWKYYFQGYETNAIKCV